MHQQRYVLAIDQGTTSCRGMVFDDRATVRGVAQTPLPATFPKPGWVNQDAEEIWRITLQAARDAISKAGTTADAIAAIGITNQRETTILWDRATGKPVAPAIVWQSRQSSGVIEAIRARGMAARYQAVTGLVPDAYFSASKIAWLLESDPDLRRRAEAGDLAFGTVETWLVWNLTGGRVHITDASNASRTMLYDIRKRNWSTELLGDLAIPAALLPTVVDNSGVVATTDGALLGAEIPICGLAGDQQAALFGQACYTPGTAKNTYGTGSFLLMNTGDQAVASPSNLLTTIAWSLAGATTYALEGAIFVTGSAVQWLRDGLGLIGSAAEIEPLAASVPDADGVMFVPALTGLGAPYWDPQARGTIVGLTRGTTKAHIARATLDAIAWQTRDVLEAMVRDSGVELTELRVDGGATANNLLMQIQANVLGVPVVRPAMTETTVLGAAYLAGLGAGVWSGLDDIRANWQEERRFEPQAERKEIDRAYERWRDAVSRSRSWAEPA